MSSCRETSATIDGAMNQCENRQLFVNDMKKDSIVVRAFCSISDFVPAGTTSKADKELKTWQITKNHIKVDLAAALEAAGVSADRKFQSICFNLVIADRVEETPRPRVDAKPDRQLCVNIDIWLRWSDIALLSGEARWEFVKCYINDALATFAGKYRTATVAI